MLSNRVLKSKDGALVLESEKYFSDERTVVENSSTTKEKNRKYNEIWKD